MFSFINLYFNDNQLNIEKTGETQRLGHNNYITIQPDKDIYKYTGKALIEDIRETLWSWE